MEFYGFIGERLRVNEAQWLIPAPFANPGMVMMHRTRNRQPRPQLVPWYGEFAGKYLTAAVPAWRISRNAQLENSIRFVVQGLAKAQRADGCLSPHPDGQELDGYYLLPGEVHDALWDCWGHYHCIMGLLLWNRASGDKTAWDVAVKAADFMADAFLSGRKTLAAIGAQEMNMAIAHCYAFLYNLTGKQKYMDMVRYTEKCWQSEGAGDYLRQALADVPFWKTPKPRWESLHDIMAFSEMYFATGDEDYKKALLQIWYSILETDRHNTGGFTSGEQAQGDPFHQGAIETCCTISWMLLTWEVFRVTRDPYAIDELELSTFNGCLGAQSPSGRWWTYDTPMDGVRRASAHSIVFQACEGSPELNCCSVNGPRGAAMVSDWALTAFDGGVQVNYYGPCRMETALPCGGILTLRQETSYPADGNIRITLGTDRRAKFPLMLRIPGWSRNTRVWVNGEEAAAAPGYLYLEREWQTGDVIELQLDMSLHAWTGQRACAGKVSVYRGPLLMAYDRRFGSWDTDSLPEVVSVENVPVYPDGEWPEPVVMLKAQTTAGEMLLCDYATAGAWGTPYASWLPMKRAPQMFKKGEPEWFSAL